MAQGAGLRGVAELSRAARADEPSHVTYAGVAEPDERAPRWSTRRAPPDARREDVERVRIEAVPDIVVNDHIVIPAHEVTTSFVRSSGPGGQNVNKVASKVQLRWSPATSTALTAADRAWVMTRLASKVTSDGELIVSSGLTRDQGRNRLDAEAKLGELVRAALVRPKKRRATRPTAAAKARRVNEKKARGEAKRRRRAVNEE